MVNPKLFRKTKTEIIYRKDNLKYPTSIIFRDEGNRVNPSRKYKVFRTHFSNMGSRTEWERYFSDRSKAIRFFNMKIKLWGGK